MFRKLTVALALALSAIALPAMAKPAQHRAPVAEEAAKAGHKDAKFPMPAAEFRKHIDARIAKVKARVEKHIEKNKVPEDKAREIREKLAQGIAKVNAEVDKVTADGSVTKEEAKQVHAVAKALHPKGHHKTAKKLGPSQAFATPLRRRCRARRCSGGRVSGSIRTPRRSARWADAA